MRLLRGPRWGNWGESGLALLSHTRCARGISPASIARGRAASGVSIEGILGLMRHPLMVVPVSLVALIQVYISSSVRRSR